MPTAKKTKKTAPAVEEHDEVEEHHEDTLPVKAKKPVEIDEPEPVLAVVDEKLEEDPLAAPAEDDELAGEELSLDGEELNPFGDRWEE
ncbi:MAG: hypothetical protein KBC33_01775 [Candidatus Pacebacteria bacterium]|nr:hypothetical protein [Candidatus Paceibacterota bacterium]